MTARRSFFIIDRQGVVRHRWIAEDPNAVFPTGTLLQAVQEVVKTP